MNYEPVIGLEVHAELLTQSKMFCGCAVVDSTAAEPNRFVCPICTGHPGTLPVINERAVEYALRVALALNCTVAPENVFARKNYFYPDLPKGYQVSQYELPLAVDGWMAVEAGETEKRVRIRRVHLEEDTGKLFHESKDGREYSLVDFNRSGVPLLEIVTEPDLRSVEEVKAYATGLRTLLRYLGVNSGDMEKGVIRFEANVSVRPAGSEELRTRTEIKNLNSFRSMVRGLEYEIKRQIEVWSSGGAVVQETLGWNEAQGVTVSQRGKEEAHDYRYFPEPDLPPLVIEREWVERVRAALPELPDQKQARYLNEFRLPRQDADQIVSEPEVAAYFEQAVQAGRGLEPKVIANWLLGELFALLNQAGIGIERSPVPPADLAGLIGLVDRGEISSQTGKQVLAEMAETGRAAGEIVQAKGLGQIGDETEIRQAVIQTLDAHPGQVAQYLSGKETLGQWLFGQSMKALRGRGNPQVVRRVLDEELNTRKK